MAAIDLGEVLTLVQTIAIIGALLATLYFSQRQVRAVAVDLESRVLNDLDEKFHSLTDIFVARPEMIRVIYDSPTAPGPEVPVSYYTMSFCAHIFRMRQRGILGDNEWAGWLEWMRNAFRWGTIGRYWTQGEMGQWFDPAFRRFVDAELLPVAKAGAGGRPAPP